MSGKCEEKDGRGRQQRAAQGPEGFRESFFQGGRATLGWRGLASRELFVLPEKSWRAESRTGVGVFQIAHQARLV